jgi:hypothetical protein
MKLNLIINFYYFARHTYYCKRTSSVKGSGDFNAQHAWARAQAAASRAQAAASLFFIYKVRNIMIVVPTVIYRVENKCL